MKGIVLRTGALSCLKADGLEDIICIKLTKLLILRWPVWLY